MDNWGDTCFLNLEGNIVCGIKIDTKGSVGNLSSTYNAFLEYLLSNTQNKTITVLRICPAVVTTLDLLSVYVVSNMHSTQNIYSVIIVKPY